MAAVVAVILLELEGVSSVVISSSCTDWKVCNLMLSVVVTRATFDGDFVI